MIKLTEERRQRQIEKKYYQLQELAAGAKLYGELIDWDNEAEAFVAAYYLGKLEASRFYPGDFFS